MVFEVIHNLAFNQPAGFTQGQFRKLDQLYCLAASHKALTYRTVECDFDEGVASYTYYVAAQDTPYLQFIIRKVGPRTTMFEVFKQGKGRIVKSGVFDRAYERVRKEIEALFMQDS
ncbi:MAG: hypothetical protein ACRBCK_06800 [Alphaproteobacteria bacterium]